MIEGEAARRDRGPALAILAAWGVVALRRRAQDLPLAVGARACRRSSSPRPRSRGSCRWTSASRSWPRRSQRWPRGADDPAAAVDPLAPRASRAPSASCPALLLGDGVARREGHHVLSRKRRARSSTPTRAPFSSSTASDGRLLAVARRDARSPRIRTAAVIGRRDAAPRPRGRRRPGDPGLGRAGAHASRGDALRCGASGACASGAATPRHARRFAARESKRHGHRRSKPSARAREAVHGADLICTVTSSREPVLRGRVDRARRAHQRRGLEHRRRARARRRRRRRARALRRPARVARQRGAATSSSRRKTAPIDDDHIVGEIGEVADRPGARTPVAGRDHALQVAGPRDRRRGVGATHLREGAGVRCRPHARVRRPSRSLLSRRRSRRSARPANGSRGIALRTPLVRLDAEPGGRRDLAQAREPAADRLVQDPRRRQRACALAAAGGSRARRVHGERRQHGAGCRLERAAARRSLHRRRPRHRAPREARRHRAPRRRGRQGAVRTLVAGARRARAIPALDGLFVHPVDDPGGHRRQRNDRARNPRRPAGRRHDPRPVRRRRALVRHRRRGQGDLVRDVRVFACEVETAAPLSASLAAGSPQSIAYQRELRRRHRRRAAFIPKCGRSRERFWTARASRHFPRSPTPCGSSRRAQRVVAEGAGATPIAVALSEPVPGTKIVCIVSGGNIDAAKLARILEGALP